MIVLLPDCIISVNVPHGMAVITGDVYPFLGVERTLPLIYCGYPSPRDRLLGVATPNPKGRRRNSQGRKQHCCFQSSQTVLQDSLVSTLDSLAR